MAAPAPNFPIREARQAVSDLLTPRRWIYWTDFLVTLVIAYTFASIYLDSSANWFPWWLRVISFFVAGFAIYRAVSYMHEIVHFRRGEMTSFYHGWNLMAGVPMLVPSFLYESHLVHHNTHQYGTANDGEYLPLGVGRIRDVLGFLAQIAILPAYVVCRFLFLTPISFMHPQLRQWTLERASSFVINFGHRREIPPNAPRRLWAFYDILCHFRMLAMLGCVGVGITEWTRLPLLYLLAMFALGLNHLRTLVAHRYTSTGEPMSHTDQLGDSINIEGNRLTTELVFPLGLRYHALHHLFPSIPYHNLGIAHRRLMKTLPAGSPYHQITFPSFWAAVGELVKNIRKANATPPPGALTWYERRRALARTSQPDSGAVAPNSPETTASGRQQTSRAPV